jgi:aspartate/methionine/tyrosine aminotransferase
MDSAGACDGLSMSNLVFAGLPTTIFTVMSALAAEQGAINLGQGFPDEDGPRAIREAAARALIEGPNQYPPMKGLAALRRAVAGHARRFHGLDYDAETGVLVTSGGTEALTASIMALAGPGDEVVLIEPSYDSYRPIALAAGAIVKSVRLTPPDWRLTEEALRAVVTDRTRLIMINSPLNPVGRVFTREELGAVARVMAGTRIVAVCDEVYEHLTFDGRAHIPLAVFPEIAGQVVRVGSAGKMFSLTGWKVGWVCGPPALVEVIGKAHQFLTFTTPPALQLGVAHGLEHEMDFTLALGRELQGNRDLLAAGLARAGLGVLPCEGTYFLTADIAPVTEERDRDFCQRLTREAKVAAIPLSVFFSDGTPDHFVRFAFCKKRGVVEEAVARLEKYFSA